jgi:bacteriocin-like protein
MNFDTIATNHNELELSDTELENVYGGNDCCQSGGAHVHSYAVICDVSLFSLNVSVLNIVNIGTSQYQYCVNND